MNLATIDIPAGYYEKTDFDRAFLSVNVNRKLTSDQCSQFAGDNASDSKAAPAKVKVGDVDYVMIERSDDDSTTRTYHTYQNGACYEFVLGLQTNDSDNGNQQIKPVSQKQVFARLEKILATVDIQPDQDGTAVAAAPATSNVPQKP